MTSHPLPTRLRAALAVVVLAVLALATTLAFAAGTRTGPDTSTLTVSRQGYLHGIRYADQLADTPTVGGWPRDELGIEAACRDWLNQQERGWDAEAFLAGCIDATEVPR